MILFSNKFHFYIDKQTLQDAACNSFFTDLATRHCEIYLVLHDVWELEEVKGLEQYGFICDVLYGHDDLQVIQRKIEEKGQKAKHIIFLSSKETITSTSYEVLSTRFNSKIDLEELIDNKTQALKKKAVWLYGIIMLCIAYFLIYFMNLNNISLFLVDGFEAYLIFMIPSTLLISTFFYGIYCGVFCWRFLFNIFDMF